MKPKKSLFDFDSVWGDCWFSSTNPSAFVGTLISDFGRRTTLLFWFFVRSIIRSFFFLLNSM